MYSGYTTTSTLNINNGSAAVTMNLNYNTIDGYTLQSVPIIQPYGFTSLPPDNTSCIYNSLGEGFKGTYVSGNLNHQGSNSNLSGMVAGESATWNATNFTRQLKTTGVFDIFTGLSAKITTAALNGTNTNKILIDLCAEITALENYINNVIAPAIPVTPYTPTSDFISDSAFLNSSPSKNFINDHGEVL